MLERVVIFIDLWGVVDFRSEGTRLGACSAVRDVERRSIALEIKSTSESIYLLPNHECWTRPLPLWGVEG